MISQQAIEEAVLTLLCFNNEQAPILALRISDSNIFSNRTNKLIAKTALDYIAKYGAAPAVQLEYLLENEYRRGEEGKLLAQTVDLFSKQQAQVQPEFVLTELDKFLEIRRLSSTLQDALESLTSGDLEEARNSLYKQASTTRAGKPGLWLQDPAQALSFLDRIEQNEFFSSGIDVLDGKGARLDRKTLALMIAASGKGKSWWLVAVGKAGMQHHHRVLHITCELSQEKTARRYIQAIFSLSKDEVADLEVPYFKKEAGAPVSIDFQKLERETIFKQRKKLFARLQEMSSYPPLHIKEFPTSTLSVEQLGLYMDGLERESGFKPDILVLDYADLMRIDAESLRIDTGRLYRELRGLAMQRNIALATATQGNRESQTAKIVDSGNVSEDWSKIGTADMVLTYSQTADEKRLGLARIFVAKNRDDSDRYLTLISQAYPFGQFCLDSVSMNMDVLNEVERVGGKAAGA